MARALHQVFASRLGGCSGRDQKNQRGEFTLQSGEGLLIEVHALIQNLELTSQFVASDFANKFYLPQIDGRLPEDKDEMLRALDNALEKVQPRARA